MGFELVRKDPLLKPCKAKKMHKPDKLRLLAPLGGANKELLAPPSEIVCDRLTDIYTH